MKLIKDKVHLNFWLLDFIVDPRSRTGHVYTFSHTVYTDFIGKGRYKLIRARVHKRKKENVALLNSYVQTVFSKCKVQPRNVM